MTSLTLALDAMGGDHGPHVTVPAALQALNANSALHIIAVGDQDLINPIINQSPPSIRQRISVVHTTEVVSMADKPSQVLRTRRDSSMRKTLELVRDGKASGCISAGNTGALMAMSKILLRTLPGVDRPALVSCLPTITGKPVYLLDLGANVTCDAETLFQFGVMGSVLYEAIHKKTRPKIALLNVGTEEVKGNSLVQQAGQILQHTSQVNYVGFVEGDEIYTGNVDVIVCDGFVGNITLKTSEGIAKLLVHKLKRGLNSGFFVRILSKLIAHRIQDVLSKMNPDHYNGASLLGLRAVVVKSHGNADETAYLQAINIAVTEAKRRLPEMINDRLESILLDINS